MQVIDCFCGVGPWAKHERILPSEPGEILQLMDRFHVDRALVYNNALKMLGREYDSNGQLVAMTRTSPRLIPAFSILIRPYDKSPTPSAQLEAMRTAGAKALWLKVPCTGRLVGSMKAWHIGEWMRLCETHHIPVFMHVEEETADTVADLCHEYPALRLIVTGVSYTADYIYYQLLRLHPELRICTGHMYIQAGNPALFLRHFQARRLIFGSGLPEFSPGGMIAHVMYADIPDVDKALILGGNIAELIEEVRL